VIAAGLVALALQSPPPPPSFPSAVEAVYLDVSVRRDGRVVPGLTAADFELTDGGEARAVKVVEGANAPVHAILALDVSGSVQGPRLDALRTAASAFLDGLTAQDRVTLLAFSHRVRLETPVGSTVDVARAALARTQAGGSTALHDAVLAAVALADRRSGRPVVVVFSDGGDEVSWLDETRLTGAVREATGVVHAVAVTRKPEPPRPGERVELDPRGRSARETATGGTRDSEREFDAFARSTFRAAQAAELPTVLLAITAESGGDVWRADDDAALARAFSGALGDVRSRYVLSFEPPAGRSGEWRELRVKVRGGGDVKGRKGYRVR
jgi:VWFA-related protein